MSEHITPVELAKQLNVRPQQIFNLMRQGYLPFEEIEVTKTQKMITAEAAEAYVQKVEARRAAKAEKANS